MLSVTLFTMQFFLDNGGNSFNNTNKLKNHNQPTKPSKYSYFMFFYSSLNRYFSCSMLRTFSLRLFIIHRKKGWKVLSNTLLKNLWLVFAELFTQNLFCKICLTNTGNNLEWKWLAETTCGRYQDSKFVVL